MLLPEGADRSKKPFRIYIASTGESSFHMAIQMCQKLRKAGLTVSMATELKSLNAQMRAANKENAAYVVFLNEEGMKDGTAGVKDMASGEQKSVLLGDIESVFEGMQHGK